MTKIPCGGFKLDENFLGINENDELSLAVDEGTPYQQLVTDGDGKTTWEDRLAYSETIEWDGNTEGKEIIDGFFCPFEKNSGHNFGKSNARNF